MGIRLWETTGGAIVYDDEVSEDIAPRHFDPAFWPGAERLGGVGGRGITLRVGPPDAPWVLRHYWRGGAVGKVIRDDFVWLGAARTRSFREWHLLRALHQLALPVPQPIAARYVKRGAFYTADLITAELQGVRALPVRLAHGGSGAGLWRAVGACIALFHRHAVLHADLSAHNIQIDHKDRVYLLDFDRGRFCRHGTRWKAGMLMRLYRSLQKLDEQGRLRFSASDWAQLMQGYHRG